MVGRLCGSLAVFAIAILFVLQGANAVASENQVSIEICTDTRWHEPGVGKPAIVQSDGPVQGGIHDIPNAEPIWGHDTSPSSSTVLTRDFTLPSDAINISGSLTFVADDGVTVFLNSDEVGNYDAMVWPPPEHKELVNLRPGKNQFRAEVYNRPGYAWFEACANINYEIPDTRAYLPAVVAPGYPLFLGPLEQEPNDSPLEANGALISNRHYQGRFPDPDDTDDYYFFFVDRPSTVSLQLTDIGLGHDYDLILRNSNLNLVAYSGESGNVDEKIEEPIQSGMYYVQVHNPDKTASEQFYVLLVNY